MNTATFTHSFKAHPVSARQIVGLLITISGLAVLLIDGSTILFSSFSLISQQ